MRAWSAGGRSAIEASAPAVPSSPFSSLLPSTASSVRPRSASALSASAIVRSRSVVAQSKHRSRHRRGSVTRTWRRAIGPRTRGYASCMRTLPAIPAAQVFQILIHRWHADRRVVDIDEMHAATRPDRAGEVVHNGLLAAAVMRQHMSQHGDVQAARRQPGRGGITHHGLDASQRPCSVPTAVSAIRR
jgi:hypothetical protein